MIDHCDKHLCLKPCLNCELEAQNKVLKGLVETAIKWLRTISSKDGSGHADLSKRLEQALKEVGE